MVDGRNKDKPLAFHTHGGLNKIVRFIEIDECPRPFARFYNVEPVPVRIFTVWPTRQLEMMILGDN